MLSRYSHSLRRAPALFLQPNAPQRDQRLCSCLLWPRRCTRIGEPRGLHGQMGGCGRRHRTRGVAGRAP
jgi:hypothetical protein